MKKKLLTALFSLSCIALAGYSLNNLKVVNAQSTYVDDTAFEDDTFHFFGTCINDVGAWSFNDSTKLVRSTYELENETKYQYTITLNLTYADAGSRVTLRNSDGDEYKYHGEKTGEFAHFDDGAFCVTTSGEYKFVVRDEVTDGYYPISTSDNSSTLYLKVDRVYKETFEEQRIESYYSKNALDNYLNGIKVDESGRIWWAWEIFNDGGESLNPVDMLKFYVYDDNDNYYGYFTQKLSDQFTYADNLQNSLLFQAGAPSGEGTYKFKVQMIAKLGYNYSNSNIYNVSGSYTYNVSEFVETKANIAKNKTVIIPNNYTPDVGTTNNIVDGNTGSGYRARNSEDNEFVTNPWFVIDLGATYNLSEIKTYFEAACPSKFEVYVTDTEITSSYDGDFSSFNKVGEKEYEFIGGVNPSDSFTLTDCSGRYVIINCLGASSNYGIQIYEVEVFESDEVKNGVVSLYGTQIGKDSDNNTALRFIGRIEDVDLDSYDKQIQIRVTYTCGDKTGIGTSNITTLYKSLTEKNGTSSLPEVENSYYFYLLLTDVPSNGDTVSTYFVEILVDGILVDNATYVHSIF